MFKSNKKTFALIGVYTAILLAIIGMFIFFQKTSNENATNYIYMTTKEIKAGDTVDDNLIANYITKVEYPISAIKEMEKNGAELVTSSQQISSLVAVSNIPQGQPLTKSLFEAITPSIYGDYMSKTYNSGSSNSWSFVNPDYIVLDVNESNTPINGFNQGDEVSIEGITNYRYVISYEENGTENAVEGVYDGILTNHAIIHNMIYNDTGTLSKVGIIVEQDKCALITSVAKTGSILFHSGYTEKWETTTANEYDKLIGNGGIHLKDLATQPVNLYYINTKNNEETELKLADFSTSLEEDKNIYPKFIHTQANQANMKCDIKITSPYPRVKITHYKLNKGASYGEYMDVTGLNTNISYDSKTGLFSFILNENFAEGYYEMTFGCLDDKQEQYIECQKVCFVIEQNNYDLKEEFKLNLIFKNENNTKEENFTDEERVLIEKMKNEIFGSSNAINAFKKIVERNLFLENDNLENDKKGTETYIPKSKKEVNGEKTLDIIYDKTETTGLNILTELKIPYTIVINEENGNKEKVYSNKEIKKKITYIKNETVVCEGYISFEEKEKVSGLYTYSGITFTNTQIGEGDKIKIQNKIVEAYSNYAIYLQEDSEGNYTIKETNNFQESVISLLSSYNVEGTNYKEYFDYLLIRGIDLKQEIKADFTRNNLLDMSSIYGTFNGENIVGINLKRGDLTLQLAYNFGAKKDIMTEEQASIIANMLGISANDFNNKFGINGQKVRLSSEDADKIIAVLTSNDVIDALNKNSKEVYDMLKIIGFIYMEYGIDLTNLSDNPVFNTDNLIEFIESLSIEFVLENGETVTTSIKVYC